MQAPASALGYSKGWVAIWITGQCDCQPLWRWPVCLQEQTANSFISLESEIARHPQWAGPMVGQDLAGQEPWMLVVTRGQEGEQGEWNRLAAIMLTLISARGWKQNFLAVANGLSSSRFYPEGLRSTPQAQESHLILLMPLSASILWWPWPCAVQIKHVY